MQKEEDKYGYSIDLKCSNENPNTSIIEIFTLDKSKFNMYFDSTENYNKDSIILLLILR